MLGDHRTSELISRIGLTANPNDMVLLNNLVFALASSNKLNEAESWYAKFKPRESDLRMNVLKQATGGLLKFRRGDQEEGRRLYNVAIQLASGDENRLFRAVAAACLAREESVHSTPELGQAIERAINLSKGIVHPGLEAQVEILATLLRK